MGLASGLAYLARWHAHGHRINYVLTCAFGALLLANAALQLPGVDASQDRDAENFERAVLAQTPAHALVLTQGNRDTFALAYFHFALAERPDLALIAEPLLGYGWYRQNLRATYPDLVIPAAQPASWRQALAAANTRPICETGLDGERSVVYAERP